MSTEPLVDQLAESIGEKSVWGDWGNSDLPFLAKTGGGGIA